MAAEHVGGANRRNSMCTAALPGFSRVLLPLLSLAVLCQAASVREAHRTRSGTANEVGAARRSLQSTCPKGQNLIFGQCVDPCSGTVCPDLSVCTPVEGAPSCSCPAGFARLLNSKCSNAALPFSEYLDPHNAARAAVGAPPLTWSTSLAARAQRWANYLKANLNCDIEHGDTDGVGQNLAWSSGYSTYSGTDATNGWISEGALYRYQVFDTSKNAAGCTTGDWGDCGHYTQVVWANTKEVGCGMVTCGQDRAYVCDYYPAGNFEGEFPYVKQPTTPRAKPPPPKAIAKSPPPPRASASPPPPKKGKPPPKSTRSPKPSPAKPPPRSPPSSSGSPQCQGVVCPSGASCRVNADKVPFCTCASGVSLIDNQCTRSTTSPVLASSVAIYSTSPTRPPFVTRVPMDDGCIDLPSGIAGSIANFSVIWDATGASIAPGAVKEVCSTVWFWSDSGCYGNARGPENPYSEATSFRQASTFYRAAKSINCE